MVDWATANNRLRADRDAMDEAKRREALADAAPRDCGCTAGTVCRRNRACPRQAPDQVVR